MTVALLAAGSAGCKPERAANVAAILGGRVAPASVVDTQSNGTVGGAALQVQAAETFDDWSTARGKVDLFLGGNADGAAGQASLAAEAGVALFDGEHHAFGRAGLAGTLERDPYTGLFGLELPTISFGYQTGGTLPCEFQSAAID